MRIDTDPKLDFSDVLLRPKRSALLSRSEVDLNRDIIMPHSKMHFSGIPIFAANMDTVGTFEMAHALSEFGMCTALHKHYPADKLVSHYQFQEPGSWDFYSLGINDDDLEKFRSVHDEVKEDLHQPIKGVCIDVANGYSKKFLEFVKRFRDEFPYVTIMAGNVVTGDMAEDLVYHGGVDIVKIGIGPGSVCTTRKMTGVGYPQLSAIIECADAVHGVGGHICADGGCTVPGDVAKAFAAGADFVMLGGMLAGHKESGGNKVYEDNEYYEALNGGTDGFYGSAKGAEKYGELVYFDRDKRQFHKRFSTTDWWLEFDPLEDATPTHMEFYGMSSEAAMDKHHGGVAAYRASEGKRVLVPYKGNVKDTVQEILGGVRSACTYTGSVTLKQLPKRATFVLVHKQLNTVYGNDDH